MPRSWSPKKGSNNGTRYDYDGKGQTAATGEGSRHARQQPQNQQQQQSHPQSGAYLSGTTAPSSASVSSFNRQRPATTTVLSGGSSLGLSTPFIHGRSLRQRTRRSQGNLRAQTAGPVARSTGFLKGPDARRMMARRAKHVSLGQLAPRDLMFPKHSTDSLTLRRIAVFWKFGVIGCPTKCPECSGPAILKSYTVKEDCSTYGWLWPDFS